MKIVKIEEVIDNWGRYETTVHPAQIAEVLRDPETWTDDQAFYDEGGQIYLIDDYFPGIIPNGYSNFQRDKPKRSPQVQSKHRTNGYCGVYANTETYIGRRFFKPRDVFVRTVKLL